MKAEFLKRLAVLAQICRHNLDEYQIELYDLELKSRGYDELCKAIDKVIINRKSNERFPSIGELKAGIQHPENFNYPTNANEIHPSESSLFSKEDIAEMFSMMRKRLNGEISYEELEAYGKVIANAVGVAYGI